MCIREDCLTLLLKIGIADFAHELKSDRFIPPGVVDTIDIKSKTHTVLSLRSVLWVQVYSYLPVILWRALVCVCVALTIPFLTKGYSTYHYLQTGTVHTGTVRY